MSGSVGDKDLFLADEAATESLGRALAEVVKELRQGVTIFLQGDLGMGKTTLSRGVMRGLGHQGAVKSPTYTIVEPYGHLDPKVYHFDLYRLGDPEELEYLGIRDYFDSASLCLVEWPDRGAGILREPDVQVRLETAGEGRRACMQFHTPLGKECLERLPALFPAGE